jgi:hypothetical protein
MKVLRLEMTDVLESRCPKGMFPAQLLLQADRLREECEMTVPSKVSVAAHRQGRLFTLITTMYTITITSTSRAIGEDLEASHQKANGSLSK